MTPRPQSPQARMETIILSVCEGFYRRHGVDAHHPQGMHARAVIWSTTCAHGGREPSCQDLEDVLNQIHERTRINSNTLGLWNGEIEVQPSDMDYAAAKDEHLDVQTGLILEAIHRMIPKQ